MLVRWKSIAVGCAAIIAAAQLVATAEAQPRYASKERSHTAVAHYARARAMCVETLEEFEAGRRFARPDLLLDAEEWRLSLVSLCEQLNRLVDPKIRISTQGVQVASNPRMVRRSRDRLPEVEDGPQPRNDVGEEKRLEEKQEARARMFAPQQQSPEVQKAVKAVVEDAAQDAVDAAKDEIEENLPEVTEEAQEQTAVDGPAEPVVEDGQVQQAPATEEELLEQALEEATAMAEQDAAGRAATDGEGVEINEEDELIDEDVPAQTDAAEIPSEEELPGAETGRAVEGGAGAGAGEELTEDEQIAIAIEQAIKEKLGQAQEQGQTQEEEEDELPNVEDAE